MPDGDVIAAREAVVVVVEVFVVVGWRGAGKGRCRHGSCGGWDGRDARGKGRPVAGGWGARLFLRLLRFLPEWLVALEGAI